MLTAGVLTGGSRMKLIDRMMILIGIMSIIVMMQMSAVVMNARRRSRTDGSMATAILSEVQGQLLDIVGLGQMLLGHRFVKGSV